ncbi:sensor histidine kinase [Pseudonocardia sp. H11422]|uniref:sensor histidine kinase n=1 Tax=Pseudonocardia sp. H11422 TaxID=2835866 RepID=UPI001BDCC8F5|nr:HAMP domain-containing sensor histidine kinase [Pseudonocardia sp. H11422]
MRVALLAGPLVVLVAANRSAVAAAMSPVELSAVVTLGVAAAGAMAVNSADVVCWLARDERPALIGAALALHSLAAVPAATLPVLSDRAGSPLPVVVDMTVTALLLLAIRPPRVIRLRSGWFTACVGLLLGGASAAVAIAVAGTVPVVLGPESLVHTAAALGSVVAGGALTVLGVARRDLPFAQVGAGLTLMTGAHSSALTTAGLIAAPTLMVSAVRVLGVLLVLIGFAGLSRRARDAVDAAQVRQRDDLRLALASLREMTSRCAERDHELRNGLAGLAGVTTLFDESPPEEEDKVLLRSAVTAELSRLDAMLDGGAVSPAFSLGDADSSRTGVSAPRCEPRAAGVATAARQERIAASPVPISGYALEPVLQALVALWKSTGMDIRLDADSGLGVAGSPAALAQVVSNLLSNCARHAQGSPVRVQASRCADRIRIRISDFGPGIAPGSEEIIFARGTGEPAAGGDGLGLYISRQLLAADGGSITVDAVSPRRRSGCTMFVELPATRMLTPARRGTS